MEYAGAKANYFNLKSQIFQRTKQMDSAYFYLALCHSDYPHNPKKADGLEIDKLKEKDENKKKEEMLNSKNQQITSVIKGLQSLSSFKQA